HAYQLGFPHPVTGEWVEVESSYPQDLSHALEILRDGDLGY
ncbi:MAG: RNA pseudouridine synthase, partial [Micrococcaceae bacterium]|nr:RNA pseudouridine synthase [Micrococcaceae bacterium]